VTWDFHLAISVMAWVLCE